LAEIEQPVLNISGEHTPPSLGQVYLTLQKPLPHCESLIVPGVSHALLQWHLDWLRNVLPNSCTAILKNIAALTHLERTHAQAYWRQQGEGPPNWARLKCYYRPV